MQAWVLVAIVAIVVWGVLRFNRDRNRHQVGDVSRADEAERALMEAERERDELRMRVQVLERIVTDDNMPAGQKTKQLEAEIESLRDDLSQDRPRKTEDMSE